MPTADRAMMPQARAQATTPQAAVPPGTAKPRTATSRTAPPGSAARATMPRDARPPWGAGGPGGDGHIRSGEFAGKAGHRAHRAVRPYHPPRAASVVPYLAVLVLVAAGVYISWHQGSSGGGMGGVIAGASFLIAAAVRLVLPAQLAGLLASRNRVTDVVTLVVFGVCLLVLGLVLPRLRAR